MLSERNIELEKFFVADSTEYIQFSIKVKPQLMERALENLKQLLFVLRLKYKDNHYFSTSPIKIAKLPNYIIDCHITIFWINENYTSFRKN